MPTRRDMCDMALDESCVKVAHQSEYLRSFLHRDIKSICFVPHLIYIGPTARPKIKRLIRVKNVASRCLLRLASPSTLCSLFQTAAAVMTCREYLVSSSQGSETPIVEPQAVVIWVLVCGVKVLGEQNRWSKICIHAIPPLLEALSLPCAFDALPGWTLVKAPGDLLPVSDFHS